MGRCCPVSCVSALVICRAKACKYLLVNVPVYVCTFLGPSQELFLRHKLSRPVQIDLVQIDLVQIDLVQIDLVQIDLVRGFPEWNGLLLLGIFRNRYDIPARDAKV